MDGPTVVTFCQHLIDNYMCKCEDDDADDDANYSNMIY